MENSKQMRVWLDKMELSHPLVIAGPCSAETEEQVMEIARELKKTDATVFRAGVWKPRTRPGNFEGVGALALPWLKRVKEETGLLIAVEIANVSHAKLALEFDVDILWIGARTSVNPFAVQEIAEAIRDTDKIVLVKNPINPDLDLWLGAVERFYACGVKNLGVIHRGFSTYTKTKYRNKPKWQLPIELKKRFPDLPIINDPSHICGEREGILNVSQTALDLQFDGLMIETHTNPDKAWSDAKQQITPARLSEIIEELKVRVPKLTKDSSKEKLEGLRSEINILDNSLIELLADRMKISSEIGQIKKNNNVAILQQGRWAEILDKMLKEGAEYGLSDNFIETIFKAIHQESINTQEEVVNG
ncbi:MAG: bifunctional 3-deoxy-7-phosphoheptulonate synthase/chorismate mutase type II [Flavobacteriaceae bacterium]|nr:bifunctional 3-deoxy-7-phosphoheptulonate synthase/chorismate mutase type II [Flavobacteriaceae bacterium]